jgi:hypothetical protein
MKKAGSRRSPKCGLSGKPPVSSHWRATNKRKIASTICCFANEAGVGGAHTAEINIPEMDRRRGHGSRHSEMKVESKLAIKMISSRGEYWPVMWQRSSMKVPSIGTLEGMDAVGVGSAVGRFGRDDVEAWRLHRLRVKRRLATLWPDGRRQMRSLGAIAWEQEYCLPARFGRCRSSRG